MEYTSIKTCLEDGIGYIALNNPKYYNAVSAEMMWELMDVLHRYDCDPSVYVIVIYGEGRAFCAGGNISMMKELVEGGNYQDLRQLAKIAAKAAKALREISKPVIARVHGSAAGAGINFALLCDFRIVSEDVKLIESFSNVGLIPDMGGTYVLSKFIGVGRLTEYLMFAKTITADLALELGLVNAVHKPEDLEDETKKFALALKARPKEALAGIKDMINMAVYNRLDDELRLEPLYQQVNAATGNFKEGVFSFLEKRRPEFNKE